MNTMSKGYQMLFSLSGADRDLPQQLRWRPQHRQRFPSVCNGHPSQPHCQEGRQDGCRGTDR